MSVESETPARIPNQELLRRNVRYGLFIVATLLAFVVGIEITVSALSNAGEDSVTAILTATVNPFAAFFIGVIATAMMQSSSATTAISVALVASGSLPLPSAVAIVMGANLGTTITANIVSLGFVNDKKDFRRAVSASAYHYLFNFFTILILFPLELYNGFLSELSRQISSFFFKGSEKVANTTDDINHWSLMDPMNEMLERAGSLIHILAGLLLVFVSIVLFRRLISSLMKARSPEAFSKFFFKSQWKSFFWGIITTAAIRSSTITTSVVVPIVAKRLASLKQASPFILGANLGTTITAFFAAALSQSNSAAMSIALAHFLFNFIGVLVFFPIAPLEKLLLVSAKAFGRVCAQRKFLILAFILSTFFFIPFLIIYLTQ